MDIKEILRKVDHTLLRQDAAEQEILLLCDEAIRYQTASVCIPPCYVKAAKKYGGDNLTVCTVIGFPNGNTTTASKCFETAEAVKNGAEEIDMVINIGWLKSGEYGRVLDEINQVKSACGGNLLKVIIETCLLTEAEKIKMCEIVSQSDADFIKTSTGFSTGGATREDIALFAAHVTNHTKIKAAGGIATLKDAEDFLTLGADRLGTSKIVKLAKERL